MQRKRAMNIRTKIGRERRGRERERGGGESGLGYRGIDRRKGEIRPPSHFRTSVYASSSYRTISPKNAFRAAFRTNGYYPISLEFSLYRLY